MNQEAQPLMTRSTSSHSRFSTKKPTDKKRIDTGRMRQVHTSKRPRRTVSGVSGGARQPSIPGQENTVDTAGLETNIQNTVRRATQDPLTLVSKVKRSHASPPVRAGCGSEGSASLTSEHSAPYAQKDILSPATKGRPDTPKNRQKVFTLSPRDLRDSVPDFASELERLGCNRVEVERMAPLLPLYGCKESPRSILEAAQSPENVGLLGLDLLRRVSTVLGCQVNSPYKFGVESAHALQEHFRVKRDTFTDNDSVKPKPRLQHITRVTTAGTLPTTTARQSADGQPQTGVKARLETPIPDPGYCATRGPAASSGMAIRDKANERKTNNQGTSVRQRDRRQCAASSCRAAGAGARSIVWHRCQTDRCTFGAIAPTSTCFTMLAARGARHVNCNLGRDGREKLAPS
jgi:hypothetical protein